MKYSDDSVQLLTVGNGTYSNDNRLAIAWRYPGNWTLQISSLELHDTGCYQCQVHIDFVSPFYCTHEIIV